MNGDIALAGFVLTAEEWQALEPDARAELLAEEPQTFARGSGAIDVPNGIPREEPWVIAEISAAFRASRDPRDPR